MARLVRTEVLEKSLVSAVQVQAVKARRERTKVHFPVSSMQDERAGD